MRAQPNPVEPHSPSEDEGALPESADALQTRLHELATFRDELLVEREAQGLAKHELERQLKAQVGKKRFRLHIAARSKTAARTPEPQRPSRPEIADGDYRGQRAALAAQVAAREGEIDLLRAEIAELAREVDRAREAIETARRERVKVSEAVAEVRTGESWQPLIESHAFQPLLMALVIAIRWESPAALAFGGALFIAREAFIAYRHLAWGRERRAVVGHVASHAGIQIALLFVATIVLSLGMIDPFPSTGRTTPMPRPPSRYW